MKFEDLFASSRSNNATTPRSKAAGGVAIHLADLDRRLGDCERGVTEASVQAIHHADLDRRLGDCERGVTEASALAIHHADLDRRLGDCERSVTEASILAIHHADLDRRLGDCERSVTEVATDGRDATQRHFGELQAFAGDTRAASLLHSERLEQTDADLENRLSRMQADTIAAVTTSMAALEARLHTMQADAAKAVQAVEATGERRLQKAHLEATSATDALEFAVEHRLRKVHLEASAAVEASETAAEWRGSQQAHAEAKVAARAAESAAEKQMSRRDAEAARALASLEERLEVQLLAAVKVVRLAEASIDERLARERINVEEAFNGLQRSREEDASEASSASQEFKRLCDARVREVQLEASRALGEVAVMEVALEARAKRSGEELHDRDKRLARLHEDASEATRTAQQLGRRYDVQTREVQAEASRALSAVADVEVAAEFRARRSGEEMRDARAEAARALSAVSALEASVGARARISGEEVHDWEKRWAQIQEAQRYAERLSLENSTRVASTSAAADSMRDDVSSLRREFMVLGEEQGSLLSTLEDVRGDRGAADAEVQAILTEVRTGSSRQATELSRLQSTVQDLGRRLGPVEVSVGTAAGDAAAAGTAANGAREEARASLGSVRELREDLSRRLDSLGRDALQAVRVDELRLSDEASSAASRASAAERIAREAKLDSERAECQAQLMQQDAHREHRTWRLEADEQLRRLGCLERSMRGTALDDERLCDLAAAVELLARERHQQGGEARLVTELSVQTEAMDSKISDMAMAVDRLAREVRQGGDRADVCAKRTQEEVARRLAESQRLCDVRLDTATRAAEQLRVTEGAQRNELWRELRDLRGALADIRIRSGSGTGASTPRGYAPLSSFSSRPPGGSSMEMGL